MEYKIANDIAHYTDYLIGSTKLNISICHIHDVFDQYLHILYPYNAHRLNFCECIKTNPKAQFYCVQSQEKVVRKCRNGPFCGDCWAGVKEWVFPLPADEKILGFISVTGYRGTADKDSLAKIAERYNIQKENLLAKYELLSEKLPEFTELETLIAPLQHMFTLLYRCTERPHSDGTNTIYRQIVDYLCTNYNRDISLSDIAEHCRYSTSHVRHLFQKYSGCTLRQYLTTLRIKRAKEYLTNTAMPISEIAYEVGFNDSNYFTSVFKKDTGLTPGAYRRNTASRYRYNRMK